MRRSFLASVVLLLLTPIFSGCLDIALRYVVRDNGSLRVTYDVVMEKSLLQMLYVMKDRQDTTADSSVFWPEKPFKMSKEVADSLVTKFFGAELTRLRALPGVVSCESHDSLGYDGVHFIMTTELASYRNLSAIRAHDTSARPMSRFRMSDSIYVKEQGDSVMFMIADLSSMQTSKLKDLPFVQNTDGWYKKIHFNHSRPRVPLFHTIAVRHWQAIDSPSVAGDDSIQVDDTTSDESADDENTSPGSMDSLMQGMKMFSAMMSGLINIDMSIESPLLLSHDDNAEYDAVTHTASWHMDITSLAKLASGDARKYFVWFRKPNSSH